MSFILNSVLTLILFKKNKKNGGENGIRTHERVSPLHAFQACAFNHSATSPNQFHFPISFF